MLLNNTNPIAKALAKEQTASHRKEVDLPFNVLPYLVLAKNKVTTVDE